METEWFQYELKRKILTFFLLLEPRKSGGSFLVLSKSTGRSKNMGHVEKGLLAICSISTTILCDRKMNKT